ncbi:MAG: deoxyribonuclease [Armatimonadetes bacterium]|nr:deoxyribonuclease [Armatimonadota bacterium]
MDFARQPQWDLPPAQAIALQKRLASEVSLDDAVDRIELAAGVDMALGRFAQTGRAAVVVWRAADGVVVEEHTVELPITLPYIPGLLAFREGPLVEAALRGIRSEPDVLLFDGQGIAHPRRLGIAAHLGVLLDRPTIGVGKTRLFGRADDPGPNPGDRTPLLAPDGEQIGVFLRTSTRGNPVYVSPGHRVSPQTAGDIVMACVRGHRLPEPVFLADRLSKAR